jgi:hypothetical protein
MNASNAGLPTFISREYKNSKPYDIRQAHKLKRIHHVKADERKRLMVIMVTIQWIRLTCNFDFIIFQRRNFLTSLPQVQEQQKWRADSGFYLLIWN